MRVHAAYPGELVTVEGTTARRTPLDGAECVAADGDRVLVGTGAGVRRSGDGGRSFGPAGGPESVTALAVGPDGTAWLGTEPSAVYRSTDRGATWTERPGLTDLPSADEWSFPPRPGTHHVRWIEPDPAAPSRLYVAVEAGALVRTPDGGGTWIDRTPDGPRDTHGMATHPDAPGRAWAAAGDGFFVTADGGDSWIARGAGLDGTYCWSVAVDPGDPGRLLLSAARGPRSAHDRPAESYVYRHAGGEWERIDAGGLPAGRGVTRPVLAAAGPGTAVAASNEGIVRTDDWGRSWERVADAPSGATTCRGLAATGG
ncbi:MAG: WD40/YVTN/BNR-like repeat-containing protein [Haloferacaceae archaeon]